jgi:tetratricopeptide (TPR) repeat protein
MKRGTEAAIRGTPPKVPVDREKILQVAQKLVDKKRYDKAIAEYKKLVSDDPGDVRTLLKIGDLYLKVSEHESAIATYEQVGEYYYREGFSVKAIAVYKQIRGIIKRHASHLEAKYGHIVPRLAEIYSQLGLTSDALAAYDEVASRLRHEGRERDALDIFKKVLELDPQNPIAHLRVADSYTRLGDLDKAIERFGEASSIMVQLGRHDDALKVLERLLQYRQEPSYARDAAQLYLDRAGPNDGLAALAKLQLCYKADPKDLQTLNTLARAFDAIGQPKKAIEVLKESAKVATEKGDEGAIEQLMSTLLARAGDDPVVQKLEAARHAPPESDAEFIEVFEEEEEPAPPPPAPRAATEPPQVVTDEVLELDDADLQPVETDVHDLFGASRTDEPSSIRRLADQADHLHNHGQVQQAIQVLQEGLRTLGSSALLRQRGKRGSGPPSRYRGAAAPEPCRPVAGFRGSRDGCCPEPWGPSAGRSPH